MFCRITAGYHSNDLMAKIIGRAGYAPSYSAQIYTLWAINLQIPNSFIGHKSRPFRPFLGKMFCSTFRIDNLNSYYKRKNLANHIYVTHLSFAFDTCFIVTNELEKHLSKNHFLLNLFFWEISKFTCSSSSKIHC